MRITEETYPLDPDEMQAAQAEHPDETSDLAVGEDVPVADTDGDDIGDIELLDDQDLT